MGGKKTAATPSTKSPWRVSVFLIKIHHQKRSETSFFAFKFAVKFVQKSMKNLMKNIKKKVKNQPLGVPGGSLDGTLGVLSGFLGVLGVYRGTKVAPRLAP